MNYFCYTEPKCPSEENLNQSNLETKCRLGKKSRNPYLMFLRDFRMQHCNMTAVEQVKQGAKEWNQLSTTEKLDYYKMSNRVSSSKRSTKRSNSSSRNISRNKSSTRNSRGSTYDPISYENLGWILIISCVVYLLFDLDLN